jgi:hypothetical protein
MRPDLAIRMQPEHPCCRAERPFDLVQVDDLPPRWTTRLVGPRGLPRTRRQDARAPLLQPTFTSRALDIDSTSGELPPGAVGNPASVQLGSGAKVTLRRPTASNFSPGRSSTGEERRCRRPVRNLDAGPPCGHPASSSCVLDGTPAGFGSIDCRLDARRNERPDAVRVARTGDPGLFRLTGTLSIDLL